MNKKLVICVHNRYLNIKRWITNWKICNKNDYQLIIIHNHYGDQDLMYKFQSLCLDNAIAYVPRNALGYDIGAFQDVVNDRLEGFPDWDRLIWMTDDLLPMHVNFTGMFDNSMKPGVGCTCMEISPHGGRPHIRTTGFCIDRSVAIKLKFPADPVITKEHCYQFEHRSANAILNQIQRMGLQGTQVAPKQLSPLWDNGYWRRLNREHEYVKAFGPLRNDKVVYLCPVYDMYPQIISSLICQTHQNWELILIHNGPDLKGRTYDLFDSRVKFYVHPEETGKWGHELRSMMLKNLDSYSDASYVVITNADNYLVPTFTEYMLQGFKKNPLAKATYCTEMVHSYIKWKTIPCKLQRGFIDCSGVMVDRTVATEVGWPDVNEHSSDWMYFETIMNRYGAKSFQPVVGNLLIHN